MFEGFTEGAETVDGIRIAYAAGGSGPPLLLLHGYPQTRALWARVAPALAGRFTVVCADLRGYGASDKPPGAPDHANYSFRAMAADQIGLMRALGHERFHLAGHDRGARVGHRLALDAPEAVLSLTLMDIVPTWTMFMETNRHLAGDYWHWYFLSQPAPFPERLIAADADFFFETSMAGWGASGLGSFAPDMLAAYRAAWRDPAGIHGACSDYRAAATIDLDHDRADLGRRLACPVLILYGADGVMARHFDVPATWADRCADMRGQAIPGGHFFIDQHPDPVIDALLGFLPAA